MKKIIATGVIALLAAAGAVVGIAGPASATSAPTEACTPSDAIAAYDEVTAEAYDETVAEAYDEEVSPAGWQRYSWTGGPIAEDADAPAFPSDDWQANTASDPHGVGVEGAYFRSNGGSGKGDWFYLEAIEAVVVHHDAEIVHHDAVTVHHDAVPAVVCDDEPEAFQPYEVTKRWLLPASWDYSTTPTYQPAIFPQAELEGDTVPACRWSQDDTYLLENEAEVALYESLDDDGQLTQDEDSSIYKSHTFTAGPACPTEEPLVVIQPTCTTVTGATVVNDDGILTVAGNWEEDSINLPFSGTLKDIGTVLDVTATQTQYLGIHITTANGTIVFEEEPSYGGQLWSTSTWAGVEPGLGYAALGTIQQFIAQNGDIAVDGIKVLYTHPEASSTTLTSATVGCTLYTFVPTVIPPTEEPPTEEPPVVEPPVVEPPVVEPPVTEPKPAAVVKLAAVTPAAEQAVLADTGFDATPAFALGAFALLVGAGIFGIPLIAGRKRTTAKH